MHLKNIILIIALQLINGSTFAQEVPVRKVENAPQEDMIYDIVDEPADFPGGVVALKKYMAENLRYPQMAVENELQGKCYLQFSPKLIRCEDADLQGHDYMGFKPLHTGKPPRKKRHR